MSLELLLDPAILLPLAAGSLLGIAVGAIPGLTATLAIALLLPLTYQLSAASAVVMMIGIFTGGLYGGSIAAIALRIPGAPANSMTMLDGHAMALQGRAGTAIGIATFSSVVGGLAGGVVLVLFSPQLARMALRFQSPEMFALVVLALVAVATVSRDSLAKGMAATVIGLMLSTVGIDPLVPVPRFTLGSVNLLVGLPLIPVVIGIFAMTELFHQAGQPPSRAHEHPSARSDGVFGWWREVRRMGWKPFVKNSVIGTSVGALPGAGGAMAAFFAYSEARRSSPHPERFGKGAPEGIVAPEVANNAVTGGALIPLLALGIPGDSVTAVILGGLVIHGITPGPQLFTDASDLIAPLFAGFFASYLLILVFGLTSASFLRAHHARAASRIVLGYCAAGRRRGLCLGANDVRHLRRGGHRHPGLRPAPLRLSGDPRAPWAHPRPDARVQLPPGVDPFRRRSPHLHLIAHQRGAAAGRRRVPALRRAGDAQDEFWFDQTSVRRKRVRSRYRKRIVRRKRVRSGKRKTRTPGA